MNQYLRLNFHAAHVRLWTWLSKNLRKSKSQWPEWESNGGRIPNSNSGCFACEVTKERIKCPLMRGKSCDGSSLKCLDGLYHDWRNEPNSNKRSKLTEKIANLPWIGRKMYKLNEEGRVVK